MKKLITVDLIEQEDGKDGITWVAPSAEIAVLDRLIGALGPVRATLSPAVALEPPPLGALVEATADPRFRVAGALDGSLMLSIRHPGFGWLHFALPPQSSAQLQEDLHRQSQSLERSGTSGPVH